MTVLKNVTQPETVQYVLALLIQMLQGKDTAKGTVGDLIEVTQPLELRRKSFPRPSLPSTK